MKFCLTSPKGGVGKTTLAVIIASEAVRHGQTVTLVEADPNGHLKDWYNKNLCPNEVSFIFDDDPSGGKIQNHIEAAAQKTDIVIIDTEGTVNRRADISGQLANIVAIPLQFSNLDLKGALSAYNSLVQAENISGAIIPKLLVPNKVSSAIRTKDETNIRNAIHEANIPLCNPGILDKSAFRQMMAIGCLLHDLPQHTDINNIQPAFDNAQSLLSNMIQYFQQTIEDA